MKNNGKKKLITVAAVATLSLTTFAGGVFASELYTNWNGTSAYNNVLVMVDNISLKWEQTQTELAEYVNTNEQLNNVIKDKENSIKDKENVIKDRDNVITEKENENETLAKENAALKETSADGSDKLKQAEKDMTDVEKKVKDLADKVK